MIAVDVVDDRSERGRLTRARRARDKHETLGKEAGFTHNVRKLHRLELRRFFLECTEDRSQTVPLEKHVHTEDTQTGDFDREVDAFLLFEFLFLQRIRDLSNEPLDILRRERGNVDARKFAANSNHWGRACSNMKVRAPLLHESLQEFYDTCSHTPSYRPPALQTLNFEISQFFDEFDSQHSSPCREKLSLFP